MSNRHKVRADNILVTSQIRNFHNHWRHAWVNDGFDSSCCCCCCCCYCCCWMRSRCCRKKSSKTSKHFFVWRVQPKIAMKAPKEVFSRILSLSKIRFSFSSRNLKEKNKNKIIFMFVNHLIGAWIVELTAYCNQI